MRHSLSRSSARSAAQGFTLTEVACTLPLILILFGALFSFSRSGQELARAENVRSTLQQTAMRCMERLADDVRRTGGNRMVPNLPVGTENRLELLPVLAITAENGVNFATNPVVYHVAYSTREVPGNGIDDDNNGLIDDGLLMRTSSEGAKSVIASGVKGWNVAAGTAFNGFRFRRTAESNRLRVALTLQKIDSRGQLIERTVNSSITIRN